jgi:hypothetical protein
MTSFLRRAAAPGVAVVAVLMGVLAAVPASADDAVSPAPPQTMQQLVRMPAADLAALYATSSAGTVPSGYVPGRAIKDPGSARTVRNSRLTRLVWQGKYFLPDGTMKNRVFGVGRAIPADVYVGESWADGRPALIFDYARSRLWPDVRDEVREVAPGLYLGVMYRGGAPANPPTYFTLDARK